MSKIKVNKSEYKNILDLYSSNNSLKQISTKYNVSIDLIRLVLKSQGIVFLNPTKYKKIHLVNEHYFDTIDTEDKAYFLGLIIADGCNNRRGLTISLQDRDKEVLDILKNKMNYTGNLIFKDRAKENRKNQYILTIYSQKLSQSLSKLGVIPAKSHFTYFPNIPEELENHFIRGCFDGDGCIYLSKNGGNEFSYIGNYSLVKSIQDKLRKACNLSETKIKSVKNKKVVTTTYGGINQLLRIRDYLYKNATIYLQRKYDKFFSLSKPILQKDTKCPYCNKNCCSNGLCKYHWKKERRYRKIIEYWS